jgi:CHAD domain-containing protein
MSQEPIVTQRDMEVFAEKLKHWAKDLPPKERDLVEIIIERSRGALPQPGEVTTTVAMKLVGGVLKTMSSTNAGPQEGKWKDWPKAVGNGGGFEIGGGVEIGGG